MYAPDRSRMVLKVQKVSRQSKCGLDKYADSVDKFMCTDVCSLQSRILRKQASNLQSSETPTDPPTHQLTSAKRSATSIYAKAKHMFVLGFGPFAIQPRLQHSPSSNHSIKSCPEVQIGDSPWDNLRKSGKPTYSFPSPDSWQ